MAKSAPRFVRLLLHCLVLAVLAGAVAFAATAGRPNELDRVVDALPAASLLSQPPHVLVDPERSSAASRLEAIRAPLWILMVASQIFILAYLWRSGAAARFRDMLRTRTHSEFFTRFCIGALLTIAAKLAAFIPQYVEYRALRAMTLINVLSFGFLRGWVEGTVIAAIIGGLLVACVLWLADRTHQWYLYTIAGIFVITLGLAFLNPFAVAPAFARYTPLPAGAAKMLGDVQRNANTDIPAVEEHIATRTKTGAAYVTGLAGSARIVLSDTILQGSPAPELRFVMTREVELAATHVPFREGIAQALAVIFSIALAILVADRIGFRRDDDEVSRIALVGSLLVVASVIVLPFYYAFERRLDREADAYAIAQTHDRAAAVRYLVRRADQDLLELCPQPMRLWFLTTHEPVGNRIVAAQGRTDNCATVSEQRR